MSEYADRDEREFCTHYAKHVAAMTREGLHSKSAIAAELAYRDAEIERLRAEAAELKADRDRLRNGLIQVSVWLESDTDAVARDYCINANHIYESTAHAQEMILTALDGEESKS